MEVLFEYKGSRRRLTVADKDSVTRILSNELQRNGKNRAQVFTANDELPSRTRGSYPEIFLLQKWSEQWDCYVDVAQSNEVVDGDKLAVIAKPKPNSKFLLLCCCGGGAANSAGYRVGKIGRSGKRKLPKTVEIQSLEYRFRAESAAVSDWEDGQQQSATAATDHTDAPTVAEGETFIRTQTGRASWKLVQSEPITADTPEPSSDEPVEDHSRTSEPAGEPSHDTSEATGGSAAERETSGAGDSEVEGQHNSLEQEEEKSQDSNQQAEEETPDLEATSEGDTEQVAVEGETTEQEATEQEETDIQQDSEAEGEVEGSQEQAGGGGPSDPALVGGGEQEEGGEEGGAAEQQGADNGAEQEGKEEGVDNGAEQEAEEGKEEGADKEVAEQESDQGAEETEQGTEQGSEKVSASEPGESTNELVVANDDGQEQESNDTAETASQKILHSLDFF